MTFKPMVFIDFSQGQYFDQIPRRTIEALRKRNLPEETLHRQLRNYAESVRIENQRPGPLLKICSQYVYIVPLDFNYAMMVKAVGPYVAGQYAMGKPPTDALWDALTYYERKHPEKALAFLQNISQCMSDPDYEESDWDALANEYRYRRLGLRVPVDLF